LVAGDAAGDVRAKLLVTAVRQMVAALPTWRRELGEVFNNLEQASLGPWASQALKTLGMQCMFLL
jgi:hypothetical protein